MKFSVNQKVKILDCDQRSFGEIVIQEQIDALLTGRFSAGPAFPDVEHLFREFENALTTQADHLLDSIDIAIDNLGLYLLCPSDSGPRSFLQPMAIEDVHITRDSAISCHLSHLQGIAF